MKKILYAFGDSYTDENYTNQGFDFSFPKWPEIVAEQLDMQVQNTGMSNASNIDIINKATYTLATKDDIGVIMILLSSLSRGLVGHETVKASDTPQKIHFSQTHIKDEYKETYENNLTEMNIRLQNLFETKHPLLVDGAMDLCIKQIITMQKLSEKLGVKCIIASAFGGLDASRPHVKNYLAEMWGHYYFNHIAIDAVDQSKIIGWPFLPELGGFNMDSHIKDTVGSKGDRVHNDEGQWDGHPNRLGHKIMAHLLVEKYRELYD